MVKLTQNEININTNLGWPIKKKKKKSNLTSFWIIYITVEFRHHLAGQLFQDIRLRHPTSIENEICQIFPDAQKRQIRASSRPDTVRKDTCHQESRCLANREASSWICIWSLHSPPQAISASYAPRLRVSPRCCLSSRVSDQRVPPGANDMANWSSSYEIISIWPLQDHFQGVLF